jgi:hypothetical protein
MKIMNKQKNKFLLTALTSALLLSTISSNASAELVIDGLDNSPQRQIVASQGFKERVEKVIRETRAKNKMKAINKAKNQKTTDTKKVEVSKSDNNIKEKEALKEESKNKLEKQIVEEEKQQKENLGIRGNISYNNNDVKTIGERIVYEKIKGRGELPLSTLLEHIVPVNWNIEIDENIDLNSMVKFEGSKYWDEIVAELNFVTVFDWDKKELSLERKDEVLSQQTDLKLKQEIISVDNLSEIKPMEGEKTKIEKIEIKQPQEIKEEKVEEKTVVEDNKSNVVEENPQLNKVSEDFVAKPDIVVNKVEEKSPNKIEEEKKTEDLPVNKKADENKIDSSITKSFTKNLIGEQKFLDDMDILKATSTNLDIPQKIEGETVKTEVKATEVKKENKKKKKKKYIRATNGINL